MSEIGGLTDNQYLDAIEAEHRAKVGEQFCYVAAPHPTVGDLFVLAIVRSTEHGYFPLSEDYMLGTRNSCWTAAAKLNEDRLKLTPREAARIVADSMLNRH